MYVWSIRHWMTLGIVHLEVSHPDKRGFVTTLDPSLGNMSLRMGLDCFERKDIAATEAKNRRDAKIRQFQRQVAKLEKMTFDSE